MGIQPKYIDFTSETLIIDSLEKVLFFISTAQIKDNDWRWVIQILHSALYKVAILACCNSSGDNIKKGNGDLISLKTAIKECQKSEVMEKYIFSKKISLTEDQNRSINDLNDQFRNFFEHFHPCFWTIEIHYFPKIILDVLEVIDFLIFENGNCIGFTTEQKQQIKIYIEDSSSILKESELYNEYLKSINAK